MSASSLTGLSRALALLAVLSSQAAAQALWNSALYPPDWAPDHTDADGRFLHDFSFAGYRAGEAPLPELAQAPSLDASAPPYGADPSGAADSAPAIQAALDDLAAAGGGVCFLPAGTYRLRFPEGASQALWIRGSGVVLRGAGPAATRLFLDEIETRNREMIQVGPDPAGSWYSPSGPTTPLLADLPARATQVPLADPAAFSAGETVVLRADCTPEFIAEHGMTGKWSAELGGVAFLRRVLAVDPGQGTISLDAPTRYPLLTRDQARVYRVPPHLREVGVEELALGMREHPGSGWGDDDYAVEGTGAYDVHGGEALRLTRVVDGWVRRVETYRPAGNPSEVHIHSNGILVYQSRQVTVRDCAVSHPQYEGGGGNGYGFIARGQECLFENAYAESCRHSVSLKSMWTSGNVFLRCASVAPRYAMDFHMHLSMANLFDSTVLDGDRIEARYRPYGTIEHGHTSSQSVIWNTLGLAYPPGKDHVVDTRQFGHGYAIGTRGPADAVVSSPTFFHAESAPEDWVEGVGQGASLEPASLYEDQLARRLFDAGYGGPQSPPVVDALEPAALPADASALVTVVGTGLAQLSSVQLGGVPLEILAVAPGQLSFSAPAGVPGFMDLSLQNAAGTTDIPEALERWPSLAAAVGPPGGALVLELDLGQAGLGVAALGSASLPFPAVIGPQIGYGLLLELGPHSLVLEPIPASPSGVGTLSIPIPADPGLSGVGFHAQALAFSGLGSEVVLSFTNLVSASIP